MKRVALLAALGAFTMSVACKREADMILPDAGAPTATASAAAPPASTGRPAGPDDAVEPLATLSSGRGPTPLAPIVRPQGDAGAAAASAATAIGVPPTGATTGTGMPPLPTGLPTVAVPPTIATTAVPPTGIPTAPPPPGGEPQECAAAKLMRQLGRTNEAETLRVKCVEKGGKDPFG